MDKKTIFNGAWISLSVLASLYFTLLCYPKILGIKENRTVEVYFQTFDEEENTFIYYPNTETFRDRHSDSLSDIDYLYYSKCQLLNEDKRNECHSGRNWTKITNGWNFEDTNEIYYTVTSEERDLELLNVSIITDELGNTELDLSDESPKIEVILKDPLTWGEYAQLPLFFMVFFLFLKPGEQLRGFLFQEDEKK